MRTCTAKQIISGALTYFGADKTGSALDDEGIEVTVKRLLSDLTRRKKLTCAYGKYSLCSDTIVIKKPRSLFEEFITLITADGKCDSAIPMPAELPENSILTVMYTL